METVKQGSELDRILQWCEEREASDLHCRSGRPFGVRIHGKLSRVPASVVEPKGEAEIRAMVADAFGAALAERVAGQMEVDLSFQRQVHRYRANFSKQQGLQSFSFRTVPQQTMTLADLKLPESLFRIMNAPRGLVLVTGPTGQGKSTTVRALLQDVNQRQALRIVSIEDPIEYVFAEAQCQIEQREVGVDTPSFASGVRNAMRQDPDVIFVGEIRDRDGIWTAMQAAETGHLVVTTLHADSVPQAIGRIREFYPAGERDGVSALLARNLHSIVCQRLLPDVDGGVVPCLEVLKQDAGVREAVSRNQLGLLAGIIEASTHLGMHSFDQYLVELLAERVIAEDVARQYAISPAALDMRLRGIQKTQSILIPDQR